MSLRKQDSKSELAVAQFLDCYFYPVYVQNAKRHVDAETQLKGIDVTFNYKGKKQLLVDEKAAVHFVNKNIPTFAFEIDFIATDNKRKQGWLFDKDKLTQYYLLCWIKAEKTQGLTCSDILQVEILLIERKAIFGLLQSYGLQKKRVLEMASLLRASNKFGPAYKRNGQPFYFYFTQHLHEKPINIVIRKQALKVLATFHKTITRKSPV